MKKASGQNNCYSKYVFFERSQNNNFKEKTSFDEKVAEWDPFKYLVVFRLMCAHHIFCE